MFLSPSHWSGQGAHSSRLANCDKLLLGEKVKRRGGVSQGVFQLKPEQNGVTKISFDRKDIMLLLTKLTLREVNYFVEWTIPNERRNS